MSSVRKGGWAEGGGGGGTVYRGASVGCLGQREKKHGLDVCFLLFNLFDG